MKGKREREKEKVRIRGVDGRLSCRGRNTTGGVGNSSRGVENSFLFSNSAFNKYFFDTVIRKIKLIKMKTNFRKFDRDQIKQRRNYWQ